VEGPAFPFERFTKLDESVFEVIPESLHDVEVIVLEGSLRPDFTDDLREGGPEIEDDTVGFNLPTIELLKKPFGYASAIEPGNGFDIEDSELYRISSDLFISASSSGHVFI
jgi:hypothetical protein